MKLERNKNSITEPWPLHLSPSLQETFWWLPIPHIDP